MTIPRPPAERNATVRGALLAELERGPATARALSARVGLPEKDVAGQLEHLARSLKAQGRRLVVEPAQCRRCGFPFEDRRRLSKPGRCPKCSAEQIDPPVFRLAE